MLLNIIITFSLFILSDYLLKKVNIQGRYYLNHFIANSIICYSTLSDTIYCYTDFDKVLQYPKSYFAMSIVFALHFYHMAVYYYKMRYDDWSHHIIMVLLALPLSLYVNCGAILGHSLFFTTGLPGGIDYFLLFLVRNKLIDKMTEKRINTKLNLWVRCPGCISNCTLTLIHALSLLKTNHDYLSFFISIFITISIYWNGIYFMHQTVANYTIKSALSKA